MTKSRTHGPLVSIVVVNWNGLKFLDDCLASLARQTWLEREFILVDNGSSDGSREVIGSWTKWLPNAQAVFLPNNTGFCRANNLAFARARGEWIALFNNDAVADPTWLEELLRYGDVERRIGIRARLLGWKAWYVPTAVVYHRHSATAGAYSPLKVMLVERNRLLLAVKNFSLWLLLQNPYWTLRRFGWNAYALLRRRGSAARFVETNGWGRLVFNLAWSYLSAARLLPEALRRRRKIQRTKRLSDR